MAFGELSRYLRLAKVRRPCSLRRQRCRRALSFWSIAAAVCSSTLGCRRCRCVRARPGRAGPGRSTWAATAAALLLLRLLSCNSHGPPFSCRWP